MLDGLSVLDASMLDVLLGGNARWLIGWAVAGCRLVGCCLVGWCVDGRSVLAGSNRAPHAPRWLDG